ncbi:MAG TPA: proline--tRNA ligase [Ktedonobacterales bacterium]|jgi:prolyl-tRNA synthetase|nr:proline--tRNA ligase [Ktedonobacterales bacterium]
MRMSQMMLRTQRQAPEEAELPSHRLIVRAGLARRLAAGIYSLTPLAYRAIRRIEAIVREEMECIGGQELLLPVVQPAELWRESGRYDAIGSELARFDDAGGRAMVLAMTHEESVTDLARSVITSYRQLPQLVFQLQTKFRDEPRPRGGLVRLREFLMKDGYSFHASQADLDATYEQIVAAYNAIFRRVGLPILMVGADVGIMGGYESHEFMLLAEGGEDTLLVCPNCGYAANQEVAVAAREPAAQGKAAPLRRLHTPGATTIAALCEAASCTADQTLKAVFYTTGERLALALIRGDRAVNDIKLRNLLGVKAVRTLAPEESAAYGLVAGYAGPVGLTLDAPMTLVADESVVGATNLVAGANEPDYHLAGVSYGRDFNADLTGDIATVTAGMRCATCDGTLETRRGIEAANIFKLGWKYSETMRATFRDEQGEMQPLVMGCYGLGITRMLACVLEEHHDDAGIIWPSSIAPYAFSLLAAGNDATAREAAEALYTALGAEFTLYDDRDLSAGVKLTDADLLGMPVRITVSARSLAAGGAELRVRRSGETRIVALAEVQEMARALSAE